MRFGFYSNIRSHVTSPPLLELSLVTSTTSLLLSSLRILLFFFPLPLIKTSSHKPLTCDKPYKMAFVLRRPFKLTSSISTISKSVPSRAFHNVRPSTSFFTSKTVAPASKAIPFYQNAFKRAYTNQTITSPNGSLLQKVLVGGAAFGACWVAVNAGMCNVLILAPCIRVSSLLI